jgi:predicted HTH transcriptional regulator
MTPIRIFISSVQKEFAEERAALRDYLRGDALMRRFFEVFLFEDVPAADRHVEDVYLDEVRRCDLYIGLFGDEYGFEDAEGVSPTEREFDLATAEGKYRLIYVKGTDDGARHPKMRALIGRVSPQLIRRRFSTEDELRLAVYSSLVEHLERSGFVQALPFEEQVCSGATLEDLDAEAVRRFVRAARRHRHFPLPDETPIREVLTHLNLLKSDLPKRAAILLFGKNPQQFMANAEIRSMHFHGEVIQRPAPDYRIFKGPLLIQVDQAVDYVLSKLDISVGTRSESTQAPTRYELPPEVVREAVVNAVAHRDYAVAGAIQISVFSDRMEVWNPGELLTPLTIEKLRQPHRSVTRNARVCEALYLAGYIEKYGTGTLMMIRESVEHALPEPEFIWQPGEFGATLWRDWLTDRAISSLGLNERQRSVVPHLKLSRTMTNAEYRGLTGASGRTATRDLDDLVSKGVLERSGEVGRGVLYRLAPKRARNAPNAPSGNRP